MIIVQKKILTFFICLISLIQTAEVKESNIVRAGYFPDIAHAAAMVGKNNGLFARNLGKDISIGWKVFNAGPSAIEALFAGEIDIAYVGPNPAINGYIKSKGEALKIVCGAASGGAGLVVRKDSGIKKIKDLNGKKIATPQIGNTQDVACRIWLKKNGFNTTEKGGSIRVIPLKNPDQLTLFIKKEIDGAWTKEPWVTRLIKEGNGELFFDEKDFWPDKKFVTANIVVRTAFLKKHADLVKKWIKTHIEITEWINSNFEAAKKIINNEIMHDTGKKLPEDILNEAFSRQTLTYDPIKSALIKSAESAYELGFLGKRKPDIKGIYDLTILNELLKEKKRELVN